MGVITKPEEQAEFLLRSFTLSARIKALDHARWALAFAHKSETKEFWEKVIIHLQTLTNEN